MRPLAVTLSTALPAFTGALHKSQKVISARTEDRRSTQVLLVYALPVQRLNVGCSCSALVGARWFSYLVVCSVALGDEQRRFCRLALNTQLVAMPCVLGWHLVTSRGTAFGLLFLYLAVVCLLCLHWT